MTSSVPSIRTADVGRAEKPPVLVHVTTIPMSLTFLRGQVGYMKDRGFLVHAVSSPGEDLNSFSLDEGIPVSSVEMPRRITPFKDAAALVNLVGVLRREQPTIVHGHTPKGGLLSMIAATLVRTPVRIYHMRGLPILAATGLKASVLRWTEWVACRLADRVLCVSHSVRSEAVRRGLCPEGKISVLGSGSGNGVDAGGRFDPARVGAEAGVATRRRFAIPDHSLVIGFVGRIVREKGIVELSEAWQRIREAHPEVHLLLVGPFEPQDPVPETTQTLLRSDPRVHLAGMDWDTPPLYAAMDVVALPTYREGFPNVPLEAAAMGRPAVATRVPGCVDAIEDGVTGTLVPPCDVDALTGAIERYLTDPELRRSHGRAGRGRVLREFRPESIWRALHDTYLRLLPAPMRPRAASPHGLRDALTPQTPSPGSMRAP